MKNLLTIFITVLFMNCSAQFTYQEYMGSFEGEFLYPCDFDQDGTTDFINDVGKICLNQLDPINSQVIWPQFGGIFDAPTDLNGDGFPDILYSTHVSQSNYYQLHVGINDQNNGIVGTMLTDSINYTYSIRFTEFHRSAI
jgi:hypothetical protein